MTKGRVKVETPPFEEPYDLWCQSTNDRDVKHVVEEKNHSFEIVNVGIDHTIKIEESVPKKAKAQREICSYCGKTFLFLSQHIKSMHTGTLKRFTCGLCFEKFTER